VIRRNRIPFVPGDLPNTLFTFVKRHWSKIQFFALLILKSFHLIEL
jgi:hypothetical protein